PSSLANATIKNNIISVTSGNAVDVSGMSSALITRNRINANGPSGAAIFASGTGSVTVQDNNVSGFQGISLSGATGSILTGGPEEEDENIIDRGRPLGGAAITIANQGLAAPVTIQNNNSIEAHGAAIDYSGGSSSLTVRDNPVIKADASAG